jgi:nitroreductase
MDVLEAITKRRNVRAYSTHSISTELMERMRKALRSAPSACNFQPWHFIFVKNADLRWKIAQAANGQLWMAGAPVTVVALGLPEQAYQRMGGHGNSVDVDVAIALDHLTLAAVADGLGTCWIGTFDEAAVKLLLHVPPAVKVVAMTPLGYPASPDLNHPLQEGRRKPANEIFSIDRYGGPRSSMFEHR